MKTYFLLAPAVKLVKIGQSKNPMRRIGMLRTMNAASLELLTLVKDREEDLHTKFWGLRHHGEWFRVDMSIVTYLRSVNEHEAADRLEMVTKDA